LLAIERLAADRLSNSTAYLIGKALLARENGHLQSFNFDYPPLPMLLVLAWPDERWVALLVGGCHAFLMVLVLYECVRLGLSRWTLALVMLGTYLLPSALGAGEDLPSMLAMVVLFSASGSFRRFINEGLTHDAFQCGLRLALAGCATPVGVGLGIALAVAHLVVGQRQSGRVGPEVVPSSGAKWAAVLVLLFPLSILLGCWFYLSWLETGNAALRFMPETVAAGGGWSLLPYAICLLAIWPPSQRLAVNTAVTCMAAIILAAQLLLLQDGRSAPGASVGPTDAVALSRTERMVGQRLAGAKAGSILLDARQTLRPIAMAGTARPFLAEGDARFSLALLDPASQTSHVLVDSAAPADSALAAYADKPPPGMTLEASFGTYRLYRRPDAVALLGSF